MNDWWCLFAKFLLCIIYLNSWKMIRKCYHFVCDTECTVIIDKNINVPWMRLVISCNTFRRISTFLDKAKSNRQKFCLNIFKVLKILIKQKKGGVVVVNSNYGIINQSTINTDYQYWYLPPPLLINFWDTNFSDTSHNLN